MAKSTSKKSIRAGYNSHEVELILSNTEELIILLDRKLDIIFFNKRCKEFYANCLGRHIVKGRSIHSFYIPSMAGREKKYLAEVLQGAAVDDEFTLQDPSSGRMLNYTVCYRPTKSSNFKIEGILISYKESTLAALISRCFSHKSDLKASLTRLVKELSDHFKQRAAEAWIVDEADMRLHLVVTHAEGRNLKNMNEGLFFFKGDGLPGKSWQSASPVFIKDIQTSSFYERKKFASINQLISVTALPVTYINKVVAVLLFYNPPDQVEPVIVGKGNLEQLAGEIERKKSNDSLVLLFKSAPELLCIVGQDGYFKKVNPSFTRLFGFTEEELISQPYTNFVHPEDVSKTRTISRDIESGRLISSFENRYRTKSNEWKWISWSTSEVLNDDGMVFAYGKDITEEKRLRDLLYSTGKLAKIGSWEIDIVNRAIYWSPGAREIYEVDDDFTPDFDHVLDYFKPGENREAFERMMRETMTIGSSLNAEFQIVSALDNVRWVKIIGESEFKEGRCIRLFGSIQNIHEVKIAKLETEKVLLEKKDILESIGDGFFTLDNHWEITFWNKEVERITGKVKEQVVGCNFWEIYPEKLNTPFHINCIKAVATHKVQHFETYYDTNDVWFEISMYPNENGLSVYIKDATARIRMDEQLKLSNMQFELVAKATNDAIWDYDIQTDTLTQISDGFAKLFDYTFEKVSKGSRFFTSIVHPDDLQSLINSRKRAIKDVSQIYWKGEYRFLKRDDEYGYVQERIYIMRDQSGKALRLIGATQDITQQKRNERSLERLNAELARYARNLAASNTELEQFAYVASHDLQEPLRMVSSFMTLLEKNYSNNLDDRAKQYIHFAVDGAKRMRKIILDLLEYSRIGRFEKGIEEVNLNELMDEILLLFRNLINDKHAIVIVDQLPVIDAHRAPIRQVFHNLIGNALKFTRTGIAPQVKVAYTEIESEYQFEVADNGVGIAPAHFDRIFLIFQRLYDKSEYEGTGMGLSVCKRIVETLGGRIWVDSAEGKGSSFFFTLPKRI